jgi:hypothetical protein
MRRAFLLTALCLVAGCSNQPHGGPSGQSDDAIDVHEAVFRYRLENQAADVRAYLEVDGQDPPAELLGRLCRDWPNLKPASEDPKEQGLRLYVKELKWLGRDAAELRAGYWFPTKYAGEKYFGDHHLVREDGKWTVKHVTNETMS